MYSDIIKNYKLKPNPIILAIESSCDETACAIIKNGREILANQIMSSCTEHIKFGGVVPEVASRAHTASISLVVEKALSEANLSLNEIDAIAVTYGSGLLGALLVGVAYAKAMAFSLNIPLIPVSHIRGHLSASYLCSKDLKPPFMSLLASGGHTAIMKVESYDKTTVLGSTLDDAVGEAFDKISRVLGLGYPGGQNIERLAKDGEPVIEFPKMLKGSKENNFSYSGLKTAVINYLHNAEMRGEEINKANVASSFQKSAIDILVEKLIKCTIESGLKVVTAGGGVVANTYLREQLQKKCDEHGFALVLPNKGLCTDNGAMIGAEGFIQYQKSNFADLSLNAFARIGL